MSCISVRVWAKAADLELETKAKKKGEDCYLFLYKLKLIELGNNFD